MIDKKEKILQAGRKIFGEKGFKDTNISEITKAAGVATGTFYNYYPSKDKIFMEIYIEENVKLKKAIMNQVDLNGNPQKLIGEILYLNTVGMQI